MQWCVPFGLLRAKKKPEQAQGRSNQLKSTVVLFIVGVLVRVLTKEHEVDPILVQQGLHLPLEALHLLIVLVVAVVAACKILVSSEQ